MIIYTAFYEQQTLAVGDKYLSLSPSKTGLERKQNKCVSIGEQQCNHGARFCES